MRREIRKWVRNEKKIREWMRNEKRNKVDGEK